MDDNPSFNNTNSKGENERVAWIIVWNKIKVNAIKLKGENIKNAWLLLDIKTTKEMFLIFHLEESLLPIFYKIKVQCPYNHIYSFKNVIKYLFRH